jgi:hypothetical protein
MDICSHSFIGTPVRGRLTPEALDHERADLEHEARLAHNSRLLQGDLVYLVGWLVGAEVARVASESPAAIADDDGPSHLAQGIVSTHHAQPCGGPRQLNPRRRATPSVGPHWGPSQWHLQP